MPTPQPLQFGVTLAKPRSGVVSCERVLNCYLEKNPSGAKGPIALYGTPGLKPWVSCGTGPIRGVLAMGEDRWVVSGHELYRIDSSAVVTLIGSVDGTGNVFMRTNGIHVAIAVPGGSIYAANASSGLLLLSQSGACGLAYLDGYGIVPIGNSQSFYTTGIDDLTTIAALDFSTADSRPDMLKGAIETAHEVWLFKEQTIEAWYNSGAAAFPFTRVPSTPIDRGCRASGSVAQDNGVVYWLGNDLAVYRSQGYVPVPISEPWVWRLISEASDPGSAWGFIYTQQGHTFYVLTFSDLTVSYDITTGTWHQRQSSGMSRWRANCHSALNDVHVVGDCVNGNLYELDLDTYSDNGDVIRRESTCPPLASPGSSRAVTHELFADLEMGVGLVAGQGSDPQLMLDWSENGGKTWSNERWVTLGAIGEYSRRATFTRLGAFRQRTYRIAMTDPVKFALTGVYHRSDGLAS